MARALKPLHPRIRSEVQRDHEQRPTGYRESFLNYVRANRVRSTSTRSIISDFTEDPLHFARLGVQYRQRLDSLGFDRTATELTEWNYGLLDNPGPPSARRSPRTR